MEHRHTETLLPEICQNKRYGFIMFNNCKMMKYVKGKGMVLSVAMSQCVDVPYLGAN